MTTKPNPFGFEPHYGVNVRISFHDSGSAAADVQKVLMDCGWKIRGSAPAENSYNTSVYVTVSSAEAVRNAFKQAEVEIKNVEIL